MTDLQELFKLLGEKVEFSGGKNRYRLVWEPEGFWLVERFFPDTEYGDKWQATGFHRTPHEASCLMLDELRCRLREKNDDN